MFNNNKLKTFLARTNNFSTSDINNFLIDLDSNGAPGSNQAHLGFQFHSQNPAAPPSGSGITAKNNIISSGKVVTTD